MSLMYRPGGSQAFIETGRRVRLVGRERISRGYYYDTPCTSGNWVRLAWRRDSAL